ncbi:2-keto-4-pentenoate hydratase/2-oxohepta-3-ene-1,7-dioic acid hydratase [Clostridium aceticum]|uniref:2-keto-4-pentenoate hydratase/2-oxohepta-3-ene-1,7-dioic acid hydratase n=1 Tax=Clostridium aceticum TaxID=84022 RepID=A0A0D8I7S0_9CLOT|nr:fumarylacetoacetate hydrolase family protein [Clostridium aceticum]AKL94260.1 2-keto-4-pentenoate hydratase/2-oxohepta-3-ene-1,7-dioic acid hydratase [Clostridium aceticum]KJF26109.1 hydrolase [Clostridium aceticum]
MYFITYLQEGTERIGLFTENRNKVIALEEILGEDIPKNMVDFISYCNEDVIEKIKKGWRTRGDQKEVFIDVQDVKICAPIPYPRRNVICLGLNYKDHADELKDTMAAKVPKVPVYFGKMASYIIGPKDEVNSHPGVTEAIDYEVELAVIIGKEGSNIPAENAEEYIFGYSILNDLSARDLQQKHTQWIKGKSLDTFTAMGPCILHKSLVPFPVELDLSCKVNGEIRQNSNTRNLIFDLPYIISDLSRGMTLKPGDIIATGTPSGVGMAFQPPKFMKPGDVVTCNIEKIGELTNIIK